MFLLLIYFKRYTTGLCCCFGVVSPTNWIVFCSSYKHLAVDEVSGRRPFHGGVTCVVTSAEDSFQKSDVECLVSDEIDSKIIVFQGEKPASSVVTVTSKKDALTTKVKPSESCGLGSCLEKHFSARI